MRTLQVTSLLLIATALTGCLSTATDKCYLPLDRYRTMKKVFEDTGSMHRAEQEMNERGWLACEKNQFHYMLRKDLYLDDLTEEL